MIRTTNDERALERLGPLLHESHEHLERTSRDGDDDVDRVRWLIAELRARAARDRAAEADPGSHGAPRNGGEAGGSTRDR